MHGFGLDVGEVPSFANFGSAGIHGHAAATLQPLLRATSRDESAKTC